MFIEITEDAEVTLPGQGVATEFKAGDGPVGLPDGIAQGLIQARKAVEVDPHAKGNTEKAGGVTGGTAATLAAAPSASRAASGPESDTQKGDKPTEKESKGKRPGGLTREGPLIRHNTGSDD